MRTSIGLLCIVLTVVACGPEKGAETDDTGSSGSVGESSTAPGSASTGEEPGDPTDSPTSDVPTGDGDTGEIPPAGACGEPLDDVGEFDLQLTIEPAQGPDDPPTFVEADCTIDARLDSDVQDGLALRCQQEGGEVVLRAVYVSNHLPLPASVIVGLAVHVRYATYSAETRQRSIIVQALDDARVILAAHEGPGLIPFIDGVGTVAEEFWGPLAVSELASGCPGMPGDCDTEVQRGGLRFALGDLELERFDHQVGQLGPHGVQVADVLYSLSADTKCDGGTDITHDFLLVHD